MSCVFLFIPGRNGFLFVLCERLFCARSQSPDACCSRKQSASNLRSFTLRGSNPDRARVPLARLEIFAKVIRGVRLS